MANNRKSLPSSLKQLGLSSGFKTQNKARRLSEASRASKPALTSSTSRESRPLSFASEGRQASSIQFGTAHLSRTAPSTGSEWKQLVEQVAAGGVASFFGGGLLTGGVGSLLSGIESLFGGAKSAPPPLAAFQLPGSQNQTIDIGGQSANLNLQDHSSAIAQAVKTALLQSSSLNDVIAEI